LRKIYQKYEEVKYEIEGKGEEQTEVEYKEEAEYETDCDDDESHETHRCLIDV